MLDFLERLWQTSWAHLGAHASYFSGFSMLIPSFSTWFQTGVAPWQKFSLGFWMAIALLLLGTSLVFWIERRISRLFHSIGYMLLLPGMGALLFSAVSSDSVFQLARNSITGFSVVEPTLQWMVEHQVPKSVHIGAVYTFFGIIFVWIGDKLGSLGNYF